jgi:hypothetical protein
MKKFFEVRSVIAQDLRTPKYRPRVVRSRKLYTRKGRKDRDSQRESRSSFYTQRLFA